MRVCFPLLSLCALTLALTPASADPTARISWDQCDPVITNKNFSGPGDYSFVVSADGVTGTYIGYDVSIQVHLAEGASFPDAWEFNDDRAGCQPVSSATFQHISMAPDCPQWQGSQPLCITAFLFGHELPPNTALIRAIVVWDNTAADPSKRYALWKITFDHSNSVAGEAEPTSGNCGHADVPLCFQFDFVQLLRADGVVVSPTFDNPSITWQGESACTGLQGGKVPAAAATWGRIKAGYR